MQKLTKGKIANRSKLIVCYTSQVRQTRTGATLKEHCRVVLGTQKDWV